MSDEKPTFLDWLHINPEPDFSKAKGLGAIVAGSILVVGLLSASILFAGLISILLSFFEIGPFTDEPTSQAIRNVGLVLAAIVGLPFIVWRSIVAQKQVNVAEQSQITDRINKAVEGLGAEKTVKENFEIPLPEDKPESELTIRQQRFDKKSFERTVPNLEVRIGAIYALERIAKDSLRDHLQIMEILCAYIRENAPINTDEDGPLFNPHDPRVDIQAAITVIGRRTKAQIDLEYQNRFRLDLRHSDLSGVDFSKGNFSAAKFNHSRFSRALFNDCFLNGTQFNSSFIRHCSFFGATIWGTRFDGAQIDAPYGVITGTMPSPFMGDIKAVSVMNANIFALNFLGEEKKARQMFGSSTTVLPDEYQFDLEKYQKLKYQYHDLIKAEKIVEAKAIEKEIFKKFRFTNWSTNASYDPKSISDYRNFQIENGLIGWPYQED